MYLKIHWVLWKDHLGLGYNSFKPTKLTKKIDISGLIEKAKQGKWEAQKELYLHYADDMMSIAIRYTRDLSSAKDLVQDAFIKFFEKIDGFDIDKGQPGPWIRRILINRALQNFKKENRLSFGDEMILNSEPSKTPSIIEKLEADDILKLLAEIPEGCRLIFNLHIIEGYKHEEIGKLLGITASASRSQLTRAKKLLRNIINDSAYASDVKFGSINHNN